MKKKVLEILDIIFFINLKEMEEKKGKAFNIRKMSQTYFEIVKRKGSLSVYDLDVVNFKVIREN